MKKLVLVTLSLLLVVFAAGAVFADKGTKGKFEAKAGDSIYVCACGAGCQCGSLAKKEAKCGCGREMVKTTVTKVEKGKVSYLVNGEELSAPVTGKYACGCGEGCNCGSISQKPGKCSCGKDLVPVK
ncbi:MAG: hypothetical protein A2075_10155 [Geobacteraceae bacterium GWC2_58_44]|nr:MAG: hypothetical protein A2075_10155 [Geobacteraceae bacterium GWC2_58_44]HBG06668.1 hypothetical protein [Geobacter sp.]